MGIAQRRITGNESRNWKGGVTADMRKYKLMDENKRRALKVKDYCNITIEEWSNLKELYGYKCVCCGRKEPDIKLAQDHIIPISRGGPNHIGNIQPLCKRCNTKKFVRSINFIHGFEITDINLIPSEYLKIDLRKIGAVIRSSQGRIKIPGVTPYEERV
jgi:hypothetical protein